MSAWAAIFDLDGTLLDSMGVWQRIDARFLEKRGISVPEDYAETISALPFREAASYTIERFSLPEEPDALIREWNDMATHAYGCEVALKSGAREYLLRLRAAGVKLAVATSLPPELYEPALAHHGIRALFDIVCSVNEVARGKAWPDIYLHAARKLGVPPERCLVFEDILPAVRGALRAGMRVYGVYDASSAAHWPQIEREAHGALRDYACAPVPRGEDMR